MDRENNYDRGSKYAKRRESKNEEDFLFGVRSVIEAIKAGRDLNKVLIQKGMEKELFIELKEELKGHQYPLQFVPVEKLNAITESNHQGVIAYVSPVSYFKIEEDDILSCFLNVTEFKRYSRNTTWTLQ